jgi:hypothetical protein
MQPRQQISKSLKSLNTFAKRFRDRSQMRYALDSPRKFHPQIRLPSSLSPAGPGQCVSRLR